MLQVAVSMQSEGASEIIVLRVTPGDIDLLKDALSGYAQSLRDRARPLCTGHSAEGIELCRLRLEAEELWAKLGHVQPRFSLIDRPKIDFPNGRRQVAFAPECAA